jgi:hypothetical protein
VAVLAVTKNVLYLVTGLPSVETFLRPFFDDVRRVRRYVCFEDRRDQERGVEALVPVTGHDG